MKSFVIIICLLLAGSVFAGDPHLQKEETLADSGTWALALTNRAGDNAQAKHVRIKTSAVDSRARLIRWTKAGLWGGERTMAAWPAQSDSSYRLQSLTQGENWNTWNDCNIDSVYITNDTGAALTVTVQWRLE